MLRSLVVSIGAALFAAGAFAQDQCPAAKAECTEGAKAKCCATAGSGPATCTGSNTACTGGDAAKSKSGCCDMPCIVYTVGDEKTCCPDKAREMAKGDEKKIQYAVADKTFADKGEAMKALLAALESRQTSMMTVKYAVGDECVACPVSAREMAKAKSAKVQYQVASYRFDDEAKAQAALKDAKEAATKVALKTRVGEKEYCCNKEASAAVAKNGGTIEYAVGEMKTPCEIAAKVALAQARIKAANEVLAKAAGDADKVASKG